METKVCSHCKKQKFLCEFHKNNFNKIRNKLLKYNYNLTLKQYNKIFEKQQGCCAICGIHQSELKKALAVDHSHKTGKIRGLVCNPCNYKIGIVENNNFEKIYSYLDKYNGRAIYLQDVWV